MLNVKLGSKEQLVLSNKKLMVALGGKSIKINENNFDRPGEYEIGGVEVIYGNQAALLIWEKIQIVYLFETAKATQFEKTHFSPCDVLVIGEEAGALTKQAFSDLLETYDPAAVIVSSKTVADEITASHKVQVVEAVKLTHQTLPTEGREIFILGG